MSKLNTSPNEQNLFYFRDSMALKESVIPVGLRITSPTTQNSISKSLSLPSRLKLSVRPINEPWMKEIQPVAVQCKNAVHQCFLEIDLMNIRPQEKKWYHFCCQF